MKILQFTLCVLSIACATTAAAENNPNRFDTLAAVMSGSNTTQSTGEAHKSSESSAKQYLSDSEITAKVKESFIKEKLFGKESISAMGIRVKTTKGVVTLSGKATSQDEIDTAVKLAKSVEGVKDVKSVIKIKPTKKK